MESEKKKKPLVMIKHYRYVDPFWRTCGLSGLLYAAKALADAPDPDTERDARHMIGVFMDRVEEPEMLLAEHIVSCATKDGGKWPGKLVPVGPFPYSRGTHKLDPDDKDSEDVPNTAWKPAAVGGQTVAAVLIDGVSFCVIEPCVAPDVYSYKRGRTIAEGRLRAGLAEMGIDLPK